MSPTLHAPDPQVEPPILAQHVESAPPRSWRQSRRIRWALVALLLLVSLAIAIEPWLRDAGKRGMAEFRAQRGFAAFYDGDLPSALSDLDSAVAWSPDDPMLLFLRAEIRRDAHDLQGALDDYNAVIKLNPSYSRAYSGRAQIHQRQGNYPEAIKDLTAALQGRPAWEPDPWNHRAYVRALGGIELDKAREDVAEAIRLSPDENASYLDTRGYILHRLGQNPEALVDLDRAIQLTAAQRDQRKLQGSKEQHSPPRLLREQEGYKHALAVMHFHRGLIHAALGKTEEAAADDKLARELGYDPAKGIE